MSLTVTSISDRGDLKNERIGLSVDKDCNLKSFLLFITSFNDKGFYNKSTNSFWFIPLDVKARDKIVVYTRDGSYSLKKNEDGTTTHFFYWSLPSALFTDEKTGAVLVEASNWKLSSKG